MVLLRLNRFDEALAAAETALQLNRDDLELHKTRAAALQFKSFQYAPGSVKAMLQLGRDDLELYKPPTVAVVHIYGLRVIGKSYLAASLQSKQSNLFDDKSNLEILSYEQTGGSNFWSFEGRKSISSRVLDYFVGLVDQKNPRLESEYIKKNNENAQALAEENAQALAEEEAVEQFVAATVERMISALGTATATIDAQLAELRRMHGAT